MIPRSFYSADIKHFLEEDFDSIISTMIIHNPYELNYLQRDAWMTEIDSLKQQLDGFEDGRIIFEYTIPRMGKRVDVVIIFQGIVFLFEFKSQEKKIPKHALEQVLDYALDLKYFQQASHSRIIVPVAVATEADKQPISIQLYDKDRIAYPLGINSRQIAEVITTFENYFSEPSLDGIEWENSEYMPTPTIIEAAQALYNDHDVREITRNDAEDLSLTTNTVKEIIHKSKAEGQKAIVFITGVPGAGKTLVGLNLASELHNSIEDEHAVFLSGNHPLVTVLQEALVRDKVSREHEQGNQISKSEARREVGSFIQMIYHYRNYHFGNDLIPRERIAIFDESQRAWTHEEMASFMRKNNKLRPDELFIRDTNYSEPGFLISTMDRHPDWAVIVCLVGGGQEINRGEAGMPEWFDSLRKHFSDWNVYLTAQIKENEYLRGRSWEELTSGLKLHLYQGLHLATSMRSFRSELVSDFVKKVLDNDEINARQLYKELENKYPIYLTRNLNTAENWVRTIARGSERYGLFASSNAARLKPRGVVYARDRNSISPENWFLNGKNDFRSSYFLEAVASEFETQGLELDYAIVAWDADFRIENNRWKHYHISSRLSPPNWAPVTKQENIIYLTNAYRVLLTRARQGFVIYIPEGVDYDQTRKPEFYDQTYMYFKSLGIPEL